MKPFERLGEARTPNGTVLTLYRHDGAYLILADGIELMSTRRHPSEDLLAEVACMPIRERAAARALIGGLGLGFTLRAALRHLRADAEVVVAELLTIWRPTPCATVAPACCMTTSSPCCEAIRGASMRSCSTRTTGPTA
jgi:hypothetical protein